MYNHKSSDISIELHNIESRLSVLEKEAEHLRKRKDYLIQQQQQQSNDSHSSSSSLTTVPGNLTTSILNHPYLSHYRTTIPHPDIIRYSRQMLVSSFGPYSQRILGNLAVLVIGAGGLGCPVCIHLAAAGIGKLGIIDNDTVDLSNLHRQIGHTESKYGMNKAESLISTCQGINSTLHYIPYSLRLGENTPSSLTLIKDIIPQYDVLVDATDNAGTRYLINDLAVYYRKPLVSGAALGTDGQIMVYNYTHYFSSSSVSTQRNIEIEKGPCYRCLFPTPPIQDSSIATSCADAGVLGPVTNVIGTLQALEVLKIATARYRYQHQQQSTSSSVNNINHHVPHLGLPMYKSLLLFDGNDSKFRSMRIREQNKDCIVCGNHPTLTTVEESIQWNKQHNLTLYEDTKKTTDKINNNNDDDDDDDDDNCQICTIDNQRLQQLSSSMIPQISPRSIQILLQHYTSLPLSPFSSAVDNPSEDTVSLSLPILLDVREPHQYAISHINESINIPLTILRKIAVTMTNNEGDTFHQQDANYSVNRIQTLLYSAGYPRIHILPAMDPRLRQINWSDEILVPSTKKNSTSTTTKDGSNLNSTVPEVCVLCRRGIDSSVATELLVSKFGIQAYNIQGGLEAYQKRYDTDYPVY